MNCSRQLRQSVIRRSGWICLILPGIARRIQHNLETVAGMNLILDFNVAALRKGVSKFYLSGSILDQAITLGNPTFLPMTPMGRRPRRIPEGIAILKQKGCSLDWRKPGGGVGSR